jgi:hypothetical protein
MKTTFAYFLANISCRYLSLLAEEETISPLWADSQQEALGMAFIKRIIARELCQNNFLHFRSFFGIGSISHKFSNPLFEFCVVQKSHVYSTAINKFLYEILSTIIKLHCSKNPQN